MRFEVKCIEMPMFNALFWSVDEEASGAEGGECQRFEKAFAASVARE